MNGLKKKITDVNFSKLVLNLTEADFYLTYVSDALQSLHFKTPYV